MKTEVLFFGIIVDITGKNRMEIDNCKDTFSIKTAILNEFPKLNSYKFVMTVRNQIVSDNKILNNGDVVAFLPPFAGG
ncbi:MAG: MoaD/ThiS family protein [Bacteroidetes bacterium]|nr:MoaD/ThiS family protein [Bacteroidota bacterium]